MTNRPQTTAVRRAARVLAILPAVLVTFATSAAFAEPPEAWEDTPSVSGLRVILVLVVIPAALFLLISLLVYLPSMSRGNRYRPSEVWRGRPEWFGGPSGGLDAIDSGQPADAGQRELTAGRGGASGSW